MVTCPRCAQQVDETTRATCPSCFNPLPSPSRLPGGGAPLYTPPPGSGILPPVPSMQVQPPAVPYMPPPGSPYIPSSPLGYAPPPGSPYAVPGPHGVSGAPSIPPLPLPIPQQSAPGYGPTIGTRTTLTGEVLPANGPAAANAPQYPQGSYTPPPGAAPYGSGYSAASYSAPRPADSPGKGGSGINWGWAGGGTFAALYIGARLLSVFARMAYPTHSTTNDDPSPQSAYSSGMRQSYPSGPSLAVPPSPNIRHSTPIVTQPSVDTPPGMRMRPMFQRRFQPPGMPPLPTPNGGYPPLRPGSTGYPPMPTPPSGNSAVPTPHSDNPPMQTSPSNPSDRPSQSDRGSFGVPAGSQFGNQ